MPEDPAAQILLTALGPIGHLYLPEKPVISEMEAYARDLVATAKVPLVLLRRPDGTVSAYNNRGEWKLPDDRAEVLGAAHPCLDEVAEDLRKLCGHPDAGDFVLSCWDPREKPLSFSMENGAHGGPGIEETRGFLLVPDRIWRWHVAHLHKTTDRVRGAELRKIALHFLGRDGPREERVPHHVPRGDTATIRVMTYNIHSCIGVDGKVRPERIARVINHCDAGHRGGAGDRRPPHAQRRTRPGGGARRPFADGACVSCDAGGGEGALRHCHLRAASVQDRAVRAFHPGGKPAFPRGPGGDLDPARNRRQAAAFHQHPFRPWPRRAELSGGGTAGRQVDRRHSRQRTGGALRRPELRPAVTGDGQVHDPAPRHAGLRGGAQTPGDVLIGEAVPENRPCVGKLPFHRRGRRDSANPDGSRGLRPPAALRGTQTAPSVMKLLEMLLRHRLKAAIVLVSLALLTWLIVAHQDELSKKAIIEFGREVPTTWFVLGFLVLPLLGFPVSILLVLAGIHFGFPGGMAASAVAVCFHNFAAYRLTHGLFRTRVRGFLERAGYAIPPIDADRRVRFTILFAAIHGPPYTAKLYLLALTDIPFRIYFWAGAPVYVFFCAIPVAVGSAATSLHLEWIYVVVGAIAIVTLAGYWLRRRFAGGVGESSSSAKT